MDQQRARPVFWVLLFLSLFLLIVMGLYRLVAALNESSVVIIK